MDKDELIDTAIMVAHFAAHAACWAELRCEAHATTFERSVAKDNQEVQQGARDLRVL